MHRPMLVELGLPGFITVFHNAAAIFSRRLVVLQIASSSMCAIVFLITNMSLERYFSGLVDVFIHSCLSSLFYGLLPDSDIMID